MPTLAGQAHSPRKAQGRPVVETGRPCFSLLAGDNGQDSATALRRQHLQARYGVPAGRCGSLATLVWGADHD